MNKRASFGEFFAAYGWAVMILIAAGAALYYFGVLSNANAIDTRCEFPEQLYCSEAPLAKSLDKTISLTLTNVFGKTITTIKASSKGDANCKSGSIQANEFPGSTSATLVLEECQIEEGLRFSDEVTIEVTTDDGESTEIIGYIDGMTE